MGKKQMIAKVCPKCDHQVAVACKACKCGHAFYSRTRPIRCASPEDQRRRTGRVRREKPNYYDSQEFEKAKHKRQPKPRHSEGDNDDDYVANSRARRESAGNGTTASRAKRRRARKEEGDGGGDMAARLPADKQTLCSIILAELNRKIQTVHWKPM